MRKLTKQYYHTHTNSNSLHPVEEFITCASATGECCWQNEVSVVQTAQQVAARSTRRSHLAGLQQLAEDRMNRKMEWRRTLCRPYNWRRIHHMLCWPVHQFGGVIVPIAAVASAAAAAACYRWWRLLLVGWLIDCVILFVHVVGNKRHTSLVRCSQSSYARFVIYYRSSRLGWSFCRALRPWLILQICPKEFSRRNNRWLECQAYMRAPDCLSRCRNLTAWAKR
jgi:hypothetical protein